MYNKPFLMAPKLSLFVGSDPLARVAYRALVALLGLQAMDTINND